MGRSKIIVSFFLVSVLFNTAQGQVVGVTKVLLAKKDTGSTTIAQDMLGQINTSFKKSGLGEDRFVSAHMTSGLPTVFPIDCTSAIAETFLRCARDELTGLRDQYNADIVMAWCRSWTAR